MAEGGSSIKDDDITELGSLNSGEQMSETRGLLHTCEGMAGQHPQEANVIVREESSCEGSGMELDADFLAEVFSNLPNRDLFEVMLVSRHWEKTVLEAYNLWKKVVVVRKWDWGGVVIEGVGGIGPPLLFKVLRVAKEVTFSSAFDHAEEHIMWAGDVLSPTLTSLELPTDCVHTSFLTSLESSFHHLKSLVLKGEPKGDDPLCICHPNLEILDFVFQTSRSLTLDCPNLTRLSIRSPSDGDHALTYSLKCPQLIELYLSSVHSTPHVLELMAACSVNIRRVEIDCDDEWPYDALTLFTNVRHLLLNQVYDDIPDLAIQWPHLDTLHVAGQNCAEQLQISHPTLRNLNIQNIWGLTSPSLDCPSLEALTLNCWQYGVQFLENLNVMCPKLKMLEIYRPRLRAGSAEGLQGPLRLSHETLEELRLVSLQYTPMHIVCPKLDELMVVWVGTEVKEPSLAIDCPSVTALQIIGYHVGTCLSTILRALPSLKFLYISNAPIESREVVLEHSSVEGIEVAHSKVDDLRLVMPSLVRIGLVESYVRFMQVTSNVAVTLKTDNSRGKVKRVIPGGELVTLSLLK